MKTRITLLTLATPVLASFSAPHAAGDQQPCASIYSWLKARLAARDQTKG